MDNILAYLQGVDWTNIGIAGAILIIGIFLSYI